ncbi:MAG: osmotically inducible protein OsmC [Marivirga sp.]|nr:osmotically inducible protein OsmC [Marivirga sp.]
MADNRTVTASIGRDPYRTELKTSDHILWSDEPIEAGGKNEGPTPEDLMRMSLASCTAITLRMYADRKKWDVDQIRVTVTSEKMKYKTVFNCEIDVSGNLNEEQRKRFREIAHSCPVHKLLSSPIEVATTMAAMPV